MIDQELGQENFLWNSDNSGGSCGREKPPAGAAAAEIKSKKRGRNGKENTAGGGGGGESSDHEIHIWTERERRKKMRNMFTNLHALLPQLPPKADKSTIVDEAVSYIKTLQQTLQNLQKQKLEKIKSASTTPDQYCSRETFLADQFSSNNIADIITNPNNNNNLQMFRAPVVFQTWTSSNVVVNVCGNEAQISVCCPKEKLGFFTTVCYVLEKHKIEIMSANISSNFHRSIYMIQARVNSPYDQNMKDGFTVEEIYKQAAGEIMLWVSST